MATRTLETQWDALVTKADPDWRREHKLPPEFDDTDGLPPKRQLVKQDWQHRGAYAEWPFSYFVTETGAQQFVTEDGYFLITE